MSWKRLLYFLIMGVVVSLSFVTIVPKLVDLRFNQMAFMPLPGIHVDPSRFRVPVEEVFIVTGDSVKIHGFYFSRKEADRVVIFFHGNYGNASQRLGSAKEIYDLHTNVLLIDYRGYGRSEGTPTEPGIYLDGQAAARYLITEKGFSESRIILYGRSLGTAVAIDLAQNRNFAGLVLLCPMSSAVDIAGGAGLGLFVPFVKGRLDNVEKIGHVNIPKLIFHGENDRILPLYMGRKVYEKGAGPKEFHVIKGAGHNDLVAVAHELYLERLHKFIDRVAP